MHTAEAQRWAAVRVLERRRMLALQRWCPLVQAVPYAPAAHQLAPLLPLRHAEEVLFRQPYTCVVHALALSCPTTNLQL